MTVYSHLICSLSIYTYSIYTYMYMCVKGAHTTLNSLVLYVRKSCHVNICFYFHCSI